jgi:addiction module HigA family antidote
MIPTNRRPTHPGEIILREHLEPRSMTQKDLAEKMGVPLQRVNTIINGKRGITAETAILLGRALDTSPEFWMNLQSIFSLYEASQHVAA